MATIEPIKITGLAEFRKNLKKLSPELPTAIRTANNDVADIVVQYVKQHMENRSGAAVKTVRKASTQKEVRVREGSNKVPYVPWLDFGGRVGPKRSVRRPFYGDGRYLYVGLYANRQVITDRLAEELISLCRQAGLDVTS